jgi:hypothetical protein
MSHQNKFLIAPPFYFDDSFMNRYDYFWIHKSKIVIIQKYSLIISTLSIGYSSDITVELNNLNCIARIIELLFNSIKLMLKITL